MKNNFVEFIFATLNESNPTEFNKYPGHCGIYLGVNSFIHASRPKQSDFTKNEYWKKFY